MLFEYHAKDTSGKEVVGTRESKDRFNLYKDLKADGLILISSKEKSSSSIWSLQIGGIRVSLVDKIAFIKNLATMLRAGLSLTRAFAVLEKQTRSKGLRTILVELNDDVSKGVTFSDALKKHPKVFPPLLVSMVRAGEESGGLPDALVVVALQMEKNYLLTKKVKGAMMYPGIIMTLMVGIGVAMLVFVVPTLTGVFKEMNVTLPLSTRFVITLSDFMRDHFIIALIGVAVVVAGIYSSLRTVRGQRFFNWLSIRFPVIGLIVRQVNSARTARTLASLTSSGVDIVLSLQITTDVIENVYFKEIIAKAASTIEKGEPISTVFTERPDIFPVFVGEMMSVGEETGKLSSMLKDIAEFYEQEVDQKTKDMSTIIEPFLMVFIGLGVGFFAISMISPMYSLVNAIN
jgi:type IV pilus assembly protein PilC